MEKLIVRQSEALHGTVRISGAKNAVLPILAACLLTEEPCTITNVPALTDVMEMAELLEEFGAETSYDGLTETMRICSETLSNQQAAEKRAGQRPASHSIVKGPAGKAAGDYKGIVFMGVGYSFMGVFAVLGAISLALSGIWGGFGVPAFVFFLGAAGFACMGIKGSIWNARAKRCRRPQQMMEEQAFGKLSGEAREIVEEGREFISHIHQRNDEIGDPRMSEKLDCLERVVTRIFNRVAEKPENAPDLHRMMSYYLPITRKLVDAYQELDEQQVEGENIRKTKQEIEDSLDTVNHAFENLLDSFFQDTAWDISSDISVLHTMMAQDGLMKRDFKAREAEKPETDKEEKKGESI